MCVLSFYICCVNKYHYLLSFVLIDRRISKMYVKISHLLYMYMYITLLIMSTEAQEGAELSRQQVIAKLLDTKIYDASIVPDFDKDMPTNVTIQLIIQDMHSVSETAMTPKPISPRTPNEETIWNGLMPQIIELVFDVGFWNALIVQSAFQRIVYFNALIQSSYTQKEYSVDIYLRMWWRDERLDYSNISSKPKLELDSKNIGNVWQPDVFFQNEKRANVHSVTTPNKLMHIYRNGTVLYSTRLAMTLGCTMTLQYYPFDKQRCPLFIQSYGYTMENIDLEWDTVRPIKLAPELEMPQFDVEPKVKTSDYLVKVSNTGTFSTLKLEMDLTRNVGFYFLQVFIPSILLVFLSWVSFWVDPKAVPARVSLGVTCVLTMTTQSSGIRQSLPPVSYVKAIDIWMCVCLMFVFAALLEFAYVNVLIRRPAKTYETDGSTACPDDDKDTKARGEQYNIEETPQPKDVNKTVFERFKERLCPCTNANRSQPQQVDCISRFVFPGTFLLFLFLFFVVCFSARSLALPD